MMGIVCGECNDRALNARPPGPRRHGRFESQASARFLLGLLAGFLLLQAPAAAQVKEVRRVLMVYEVGNSSPGVTLVDQGIRSALGRSAYQIEFHSEYMETILFPDPIVQDHVHDLILRKYQARRPDLIISVGPSASQFMVDSHDEFFPGIPVVFCFAMEDVGSGPGPDSAFTGVWTRLEPAKTLEAAMRLQPGTQHVVVVGGSSPFDKLFEDMVREDLRGESKLDIAYLTGLDLPSLLERLKKLPDHTVVLLSAFAQDAAGTRFLGGPQLAPLVVSASHAPVFSLFDVFLNHGEVGGEVFSFAKAGEIAGEMALRVLQGERPQDIPRVRGARVGMYDWGAMRRWDLETSNLPAGAVVFNRQPTLWELYERYILGGIVLMLAQTLLISGLLRQRAKKRKAEAKLIDQLRFESFVSDLSTDLVNAPEEQIEQKIQQSLARIGELLGVERITLRELSADRTEFRATLMWRAAGVDATQRAIKVEQNPRWAGATLRGEVVTASDVSALPKEAHSEREHFLKTGALSAATVPLTAGTQVFGSITFISSSFRIVWADDLVKQLKILAELFSNALTRKRTTQALHASIAELRSSQASLRELSRHLINAGEKERIRISHELHDDLGQRMALISICLSQIETAAATSPSELRKQVQNLAKHVDEVSNIVLNLSHQLHPSKLDILGLIPALRDLCREFSGQHNLKVQFINGGLPDQLPKETALCLYRIVQEALRNVVKHSGASQATVELSCFNNGIELSVSDSGVGFQPHAPMERVGLGLTSMRERLHPLEGRLIIESEPSRGTRIRVHVPFPAVTAEQPSQ
jgi:signal transduction histidine kinase/ABC-type uncharacterized transport system substrate-binding protein